MANNRRNNKLVVPGVRDVLTQMRNEIAAELGYSDYDSIDKGNLPARVHGAIGGTITKRLIELGQQALLNGGQANIHQSDLDINEYRQDLEQDMANDATPNQIIQ